MPCTAAVLLGIPQILIGITDRHCGACVPACALGRRQIVAVSAAPKPCARRRQGVLCLIAARQDACSAKPEAAAWVETEARPCRTLQVADNTYEFSDTIFLRFLKLLIEVPPIKRVLAKRI